MTGPPVNGTGRPTRRDHYEAAAQLIALASQNLNRVDTAKLAGPNVVQELVTAAALLTSMAQVHAQLASLPGEGVHAVTGQALAIMSGNHDAIAGFTLAVVSVLAVVVGLALAGWKR